jgi:leucyl/phenylalanyl-tRNA--protein transferase
VTFDQAFARVVRECARPRPGQQGTWISRDIFTAYTNLHQRGVAHSVEVWVGDELAGGLYGLAIGAVFFGESMFSRQRDASKTGFAWCVTQLRQWGYQLIDCQVYNDHLASLGASEMPRPEFAAQLARLCDLPLDHPWQFSITREAICDDSQR